MCKVVKSRLLKSVFGPKREEVIGGRRDCLMKSFIIRFFFFTKLYQGG
jgi:hypothetical protein